MTETRINTNGEEIVYLFNDTSFVICSENKNGVRNNEIHFHGNATLQGLHEGRKLLDQFLLENNLAVTAQSRVMNVYSNPSTSLPQKPYVSVEAEHIHVTPATPAVH